MLPKIAHYGGFQSYGDLAYPSLKAGKPTLDSNTIYQETVRKDDDLKLYQNVNRWHSVYDQTLNQNVQPEHYEDPIRITKHQVEKSVLSTAGRSTMSANDRQGRSATKSDGFGNIGDVQLHGKGYDLLQKTVAPLKKDSPDSATLRRAISQDASQKLQGNEEGLADNEFLRTGVEHWKTSYNAAIQDPYALTRATRPDWTLHRAPHQVEGGPIASDYKTQYGDRGTDPRDKFSSTFHVPRTDEVLKLGTTQASFHIPGYTGHIPKSIINPDMKDQSLGVNSRQTYLKQNITENYQTRVPGYAGHRPANAVNDRGSLRQFCFTTAGERFY